jgi:hypothetical protein
MRENHYSFILMKRLLFWLLCMLTLTVNLHAESEQSIIEHSGDRYVINVEALKPDKEMTLMDVLQICPELVSANGKRITGSFELRVDNITLTMDDEAMLEHLKASEINTVEVYLYTSVAISGAGNGGIIDVYLRQQEDGKTSGKLQMEGSTRGNGKVYADVTTRDKNVTLRGYALTNLGYARGSLEDYDWFSSRQGVENMHLAADWDISEDDNLKIKLFQVFQDSKHRFGSGQDDYCLPELQRYGMAVASYTHTLNERGATLLAEGGADYLNQSTGELKQRRAFTYFFAETSQPCLDNDLTVLAGWEIDYDNLWNTGYDRQQMMFNDLYLQLDYAKGPWMLTLGDRFRITNYWHRTYDTEDALLWNNNRVENSFLASAGYKAGKHFVQAIFNRDYFVPLIDDLYSGYNTETNRLTHRTGYQTPLICSTEGRYAYQNENLVVSGGAFHSWTTHSAGFDEQLTGVRSAVTWLQGPLRLTAGADFFHVCLNAADYTGSRHDNYFNLRLMPSLQLAGGVRVSSRLLYSSRRSLLAQTHPHLYASVKASKDIGQHITLYADFHDLAGAPGMYSLQLGSSYDDRALTLGFIYRFR